MKRFVCVLLCLLLASVGLMGSTYPSIRVPELKYPKEYQSSAAAQALEDVVDVEALRSHLFEELKSFPDQLILTEFAIPYSETVAQALRELVWYEMPESFQVYGAGVGQSNGIVYGMAFSYDETPESYAEKYAACEKAANRILYDIKDNDRLGEAEKALLIHDRLAVLCQYDTTLSRENTHDMAGVLVNRNAVCQGYAMAFSWLAHLAGLKVRYCSSDVLNHGWNIVTVDGEEYHVDVTWDDPTNDKTGRVLHENFLRSAAGIYATGHHEDGVVDYDTDPDSTLYDEAFWQDVNTEFQLVNDTLYYLDSAAAAIKEYESREAVHSVEDLWMASEDGFWPGNFSSLSSDGVNLLYNGYRSVYAYDPAADSTKTVYTLTVEEGVYDGIYALTCVDGDLRMIVDSTPNFRADTEQTKALMVDYLTEGDPNNDGEIDGADSILLLQQLAEWDAESYPYGADCNGDGLINGADSILLLQYLAEWDVTLG